MTDETKTPESSFTVTKKTKVAIIGCADSKKLAPYDKADEWEFWGVNNLHLTMPKAPWSRWFELHHISFDGTTYKRRGEVNFRGQPVDQYLASLQALNIPVYMQRQWPVIKNAIQYPLETVISKFGNYFTNTISYEIALAILEGFTTIGIWGVDMAVSSPLRAQNEYSHQRPSCEYFIGLARGIGIQIIVPDECDLLKTRFLYGFHYERESAFNKKLNDMKKSMIERHNNAQAKRSMADKQCEQYVGAISAIDEILKIQGND